MRPRQKGFSGRLRASVNDGSEKRRKREEAAANIRELRYAPALWPVEVVNALVVAERKKPRHSRTARDAATTCRLCVYDSTYLGLQYGKTFRLQRKMRIDSRRERCRRRRKK